MDIRYKGMTPERALEIAREAFEDVIDTVHWVAARNAKGWRRDTDEETITKSIDRSRLRFNAALDNLRYALTDQATAVDQTRQDATADVLEREA